MGKYEYSEAFKHTAVCCFALFALSLFMLVSSAGSAEAQSRAALCRSLNSQLASLSGGSGGGNPSQYRKFNNAAKSQKAQIKKTKRIAKRGRCTGFGIFNSRSAQCKRIIGSLKKMEANLRNLRSKAAKYAPKRANSSSKRKSLLRRIKQNRCNAVVTKKAKKVTKPKRKTLLEQVFGTKTYNENGKRVNSGGNQVLTSLRTYRTLCVRKTDGYYFPISFSTSKDRFEDDQQTCQKMCPSVEVDLYHHKMPSEDSEEMVHYQTKKPYAKEPFAFAYRKSVDVNQKCRFATENRNNSIETVTVDKKTSTKIGTPVWREDPALAPDDHESLIAGLNFKVVKAFVEDDSSTGKDADNQLLADNRKVRIVGPAFFPVQ